MMRNVYIAAALILWCHVQAHAQNTTVQVEAHGAGEKASAYLERLIRRQGAPDEDSLEAVSDSIKAYYEKQGFFHAEVDSIVLQENRAHVFVTEGPRARFGRVSLSMYGSGTVPRFSEMFAELDGGPYSAAAVESRINDVLNEMEYSGFPLARIDLVQADADTGRGSITIDLAFSLSTGSPVRFSNQYTSGNTVTKKAVILRETRIKQGQLFSPARVAEARRNLVRLGFFDRVDEPEIVLYTDSAAVYWKVKEGKTSVIDGVIGFNPPDNERDTGYVTGKLQFTFNNFLGTGRYIDVRWEKLDELSQKMDLAFREPWIARLPVHAGAGFTQEIRDSTYIERAFDIQVSYAPSRLFSLAVSGGTRDVFPDSAGVLYHDIPETRTVFASAGIEYNTLDVINNPSKGVRYAAQYKTGSRYIAGPGFIADTASIGTRTVYRNFSVDVEIAWPFAGNHVLYLGLHHRDVSLGGSFVPLSDQIRFGGTTTLRGYDEDSFRGTSVAWLNAEYRLVTGFRSRIFLFADAGIYQRQEKDETQVRKFKAGFGAGLRFDTPLGVVGIDYGVAKGNSFSRGKIHIRVINTF